MIVASAANFGLSSFPEEFDDYYKNVKIMAFITIGVIILLALIYGIYMLFRSSPSFDTRFKKSAPGFNV